MTIRFTTPLETRFWEKVRFCGAGPSDCWEWDGAYFGNGYGFLNVGSKADGSRRPEGAARIAWKLTNGELPPGMSVLHRCDNPRCVRPDHLFIGTQRDNMRDMASKGRASYKGTSNAGGKNGRSRLTEEQVAKIRSRYVEGGVTQRALAAEYGVSQGAIWMALAGRNWRAA